MSHTAQFYISPVNFYQVDVRVTISLGTENPVGFLLKFVHFWLNFCLRKETSEGTAVALLVLVHFSPQCEPPCRWFLWPLTFDLCNLNAKKPLCNLLKGSQSSLPHWRRALDHFFISVIIWCHIHYILSSMRLKLVTAIDFGDL